MIVLSGQLGAGRYGQCESEPAGGQRASDREILQMHESLSVTNSTSIVFDRAAAK